METVRDQILKGFTPFFQKQLAVLDKGISAATREAGTEGATQLTDNAMDMSSGLDVQLMDGVGDSFIIGGFIGAGLVSPQVLASRGGNNAYVKSIKSVIPKDASFEDKLELIDLLVESDEIAFKSSASPEAAKPVLKERLSTINERVAEILTDNQSDLLTAKNELDKLVEEGYVEKYTDKKGKEGYRTIKVGEAPQKPVESETKPSEGKPPLKEEKPPEELKEAPISEGEVEVKGKGLQAEAKEASKAEEAKGDAVLTQKPEPPKKPPKPPKPTMEDMESVSREEEVKVNLPKITDKNFVSEINKAIREYEKAVKKERLHTKEEFRQKVLNRRIALNLGAYKIAYKVHGINKVTTKSEREAVSLLLEKAGVPEELMGTEVEKIYNNPSPKVKMVAKIAKQHFDSTWEDIVRNTENMTAEQIKDYVTHIWDIPKAQVGEVANWFSTRNRFLNKRYIPTLKEGMDKFNLTPKTLDIGEIMKVHARAARIAIENNKFLNDLKTLDIGGVPAMAKRGQAPGGYIEYKRPAFKYKKWLGKDEAGKPILGNEYYMIHPDMEKYFDAIFSSGRLDAKGFDRFWQGFENVGNYLKKMALSASLFHHGALTETAIANLGAKSIKVLGKDILWDSAMSKFQDSPAFKNPAVAKRAIKYGVQVGATQDFDVSKIQDNLNTLAEASRDLPMVKYLTKGFAKFNEKWDKALWEYLHDGYKIYTFESLADKIDPDVVDSKTYEAKLKEIAQFVNDSYGGQNWDVLLISPIVQRVLRSFLLSPDWTISTIRQALAPTGVGALYKNSSFWRLADKNNPINARRKVGAMFWIKGAIYYGISMNLLNAARRIKDIEENPDLYTPAQLQMLKDFKLLDLKSPEYLKKLMQLSMAGNTVGHKTHVFMGRYKDGSEHYVREGKQFRELPELFMGDDGFSIPQPALRKMGGKMSPLLQLGFQMFTGHTASAYENYDLKDQEGWGYAMGIMKTAAKMLAPYASANFFRGDKEWMPIDMVMPSSKGMTPGKAIGLYEKGIDAQDPQYVSEVFQGAVNNRLDAFYLYTVAQGNHYATIGEKSRVLSNDIEKLEKEIKKEKDPNKRERLEDRASRLYEKEDRIKEARESEAEIMDILEDYLSQYNKKWGPSEE